MQTKAAAAASTAAEESVEPLWLRPEAIPEGAEETEPGLPSGSEEEAKDLEGYSPQHGRGSPGSPQSGEEEDSNTLELVDRSPGSSMSSGLQDQSEAYDKGKGKGKQVTAEDLYAAGFSSFISAGTASSSTPYSRTDERGPGLPSGPRNQGKGSGKGRRKGKGKAKGRDKGWDMSLAMPVREKRKRKSTATLVARRLATDSS